VSTWYPVLVLCPYLFTPGIIDLLQKIAPRHKLSTSAFPPFPPSRLVLDRPLRMLLKRCATVISEGSWRRENGSLQEKRIETDQPEVKTKNQKS